jgi:hypothetical protein
MLDRLLSLLIAFSLAMLVWLYAKSRDQEVLEGVPVAVQVTASPVQTEQYDLEVAGPAQVLVTFTASPARIRELRSVLQRNELQVSRTVTVPEDRLNEPRWTDTVRIEPSDVPTPPGVKALVVEGRNRISVVMHRLVERRLPVRFEHAQEEDGGTPITLDPPTVLVRGPQEVLDRARSIATEPAALPARPLNAAPGSSVFTRVAVVQELERRPVRTVPARVTIRVPAQPRKRYELVDVPVHFLCPANFPLRPQFIDERAGRITLRVQGPVQDEPPRVWAFVDLTRGRFTSRLNDEPLQVQLPKDFTLLEEPPRVIAFELVPADSMPRSVGTLPPP